MTFCLENNSTHEYIRLDNLFHEALFTYCGNAYLQQSYVLISAQMATIRNYLGSNDEHMHRSHQQHVAIIQAIRMRMPKSAPALQEHILPEKALIGDSSAKKTATPSKADKRWPGRKAPTGPDDNEVLLARNSNTFHIRHIAAQFLTYLLNRMAANRFIYITQLRVIYRTFRNSFTRSPGCSSAINGFSSGTQA